MFAIRQIEDRPVHRRMGEQDVMGEGREGAPSPSAAMSAVEIRDGGDVRPLAIIVGAPIGSVDRTDAAPRLGVAGGGSSARGSGSDRPRSRGSGTSGDPDGCIREHSPR